MYNAKNAKEGKDATQLNPDSILDAVIVNIDDGLVKQFIPAGIEWKGDVEGRAINVTLEVRDHDGKAVNVTQLFTYKEENGSTIYTPKSNLGKYHKKYGKLPEPGDQVKVITNNEGFGKVKLE